MRRASATALAAAALLAAGSAPASAAGAGPARVCAKEVALREAPGGIVVGHLRRPERVSVLQRSSDGRWVRVRTTTRRRGWLPEWTLCDR